MLVGEDMFFKIIKEAEVMFRQLFPNHHHRIPDSKVFQENMKIVNALLNLPANFHCLKGFPKNHV